MLLRHTNGENVTLPKMQNIYSLSHFRRFRFFVKCLTGFQEPVVVNFSSYMAYLKYILRLIILPTIFGGFNIAPA